MIGGDALHAVLQGYGAPAPDLIPRYDALSVPDILFPVLDLLPGPGAHLLDIGAATGRDAGWLAARGVRVLAAEPVAAFRRAGQRLHPSGLITWADDALPGMPRTRATGLRFDTVLLNGVWHHLPPAAQDAAMPVLRALAAPGGRAILSLRHGPPAPGARPFPALPCRTDPGDGAKCRRHLDLADPDGALKAPIHTVLRIFPPHLARSFARARLDMRKIRTISSPNDRSPRMLDEIDTRLLASLQKNGHLTAHELGEVLNLSPSQAGRRRQRLEAEGYIQGYSARLDPARLGLAVQAFLQVQLNNHPPQNGDGFGSLVRTRPDIVGAWTITGEADYLLRVYCADLPALNRLIHEVLLPHPTVTRVQSQIVMDQPKRDAPLPT